MFLRKNNTSLKFPLAHDISIVGLMKLHLELETGKTISGNVQKFIYSTKLD